MGCVLYLNSNLIQGSIGNDGDKVALIPPAYVKPDDDRLIRFYHKLITGHVDVLMAGLDG